MFKESAGMTNQGQTEHIDDNPYNTRRHFMLHYARQCMKMIIL